MHHRHVLCVAVGDCGDRSELTNPVRGEQRSNAPEPAVTISRVTGVQLIRTPGPPDSRVIGDMVEQGPTVITRYREDMVDTELDEPVDEVITDPIAARGHCGSSCSVGSLAEARAIRRPAKPDSPDAHTTQPLSADTADPR